jgi:hypothetical protein
VEPVADGDGLAVVGASTGTEGDGVTTEASGDWLAATSPPLGRRLPSIPGISPASICGTGQPSGIKAIGSVGQFFGKRTPGGGSGNFCLGCPLRAPFMKAVHMAAGKEPPVTVFKPPVPDKDCGVPLASSLAIMTAAASWGV